MKNMNNKNNKNNIINVTRSSMPSLEEYVDEIKEIWTSHWLTNMGVKHKELQTELESFLQVPHVTLYTNGHLALESAIAAMNLPKGSEVITTPFTFASTTHAIVRNGLIPIFCDINQNDFTIDVKKMEELITEKTSAIVPVHVYGNMCDVEALDKLAKKYNLKVIYDAAHAFAVTYKGISSACFGDASMYSFHATKIFHTIEGGAVCFRDDNMVQVLDDMKNFGIRDPENCEYIGGNAKMSEFQAAMGICNLRHIREEIDKRHSVYDAYIERLDGMEGIRLNKIQKDVTSNYAYFPVIFDGYRYNRDEVFERLKQHGINVRKYFYPLTSSFKCYNELEKMRGESEQTSVAKHVAENVLTLPMYAGLLEADINKICNIILSCESVRR